MLEATLSLLSPVDGDGPAASQLKINAF